MQQGWEKEPGSKFHGNLECAGTLRKSWRPKILGILGPRHKGNKGKSGIPGNSVGLGWILSFPNVVPTEIPALGAPRAGIP